MDNYQAIKIAKRYISMVAKQSIASINKDIHKIS